MSYESRPTEATVVPPVVSTTTQDSEDRNWYWDVWERETGREEKGRCGSEGLGRMRET